jgi:hypothetical protein
MENTYSPGTIHTTIGEENKHLFGPYRWKRSLAALYVLGGTLSVIIAYGQIVSRQNLDYGKAEFIMCDKTLPKMIRGICGIYQAEMRYL